MAQAFLCLQENIWLCVTCIVSSTWYLPNNYPNQCWIKKMYFGNFICKKLHFFQFMVFSNQLSKSAQNEKQKTALFPSHFSQYRVLSNQLPKSVQNEKNYIILAILVTHSCTHSLTVCKIVTFSRPVKFLYLRFVNKMFQCQIFAELCVIKMDLFNRLDLESNKKKPSNHEFTVCMWLFLTI